MLASAPWLPQECVVMVGEDGTQEQDAARSASQAALSPAPVSRARWALVVAGFMLPLLALAGWVHWQLRLRARTPAYVARVVLPDGAGGIGLPPVLGPADASRPLVVIDAGHGGHDPGASGPGGAREKGLTLALALAVRDALLADGRVRVAMTRSDDRFLVLQERAGIARRLHADLFVSIHADAAEAGDASGATVYTLSDKGSDALADALAARENRADMINGVSLDGKDDVVSGFLVDLSRQRMRASAQRFAGLVHREAADVLHFREVPLKQAAFVVLKSPDLPSVLLEAGYVSNAEDVRLMTSRAWRDRFGTALARAISIFLASETGPADAAP